MAATAAATAAAESSGGAEDGTAVTAVAATAAATVVGATVVATEVARGAGVDILAVATGASGSDAVADTAERRPACIRPVAHIWPVRTCPPTGCPWPRRYPLRMARPRPRHARP